MKKKYETIDYKYELCYTKSGFSASDSKGGEIMDRSKEVEQNLARQEELRKELEELRFTCEHQGMAWVLVRPGQESFGPCPVCGLEESRQVDYGQIKAEADGYRSTLRELAEESKRIEELLLKVRSRCDHPGETWERTVIGDEFGPCSVCGYCDVIYARD